ncbi:MAG: hypothetical protein ACYTG6_00420 [Planctomycetota bacterium]|jgi:hypothetical protein
MRSVARLCVGLVVLYFVAVGAFAVLHYDGSRPAAGTVFGDFHAFLGFGSDAAPARAAPPAPGPTVVQAPPTHPAPLPPPPPDPLDRVDATLRQVATEAPRLRTMDRGPAFENARVTALARLSEAREILNPILDRDPENDRANRLWDRLQRLYVALKKI